MTDEAVHEDPQEPEVSTVTPPEAQAVAEVAAAEDPIILDDVASPEELEQLYEESLKHIKEGEIVRGRIVYIERDAVLVDVGYKSEGNIDLDEFPGGGKDLQVGEEVDVLLEEKEDRDGQVILSKEKANRIKIWDEISKKYENNEVVEGVAAARIKGGLTVDIGLKAFLPGSQIDLRPVRNLDRLIGEKLSMRIIKLNKRRGNIVLSRRVLLEEERQKAKDKTLASLEEGQVIEGVAKNITEYGAFIDLGGIDGLLHITDMSWGRVGHPSEIFSINDKVRVVVLKFDQEHERVSLGLKQMTPDPWTAVEEKYPETSHVSGKVVSITDYGAFVELEEGIEGLVHVSQMSWARRTRHPSKIVSIGDIIEAVVLNVDKDRKRISLGMKQIQPNPWSTVDERYPVESEVEGKVRNLTDFGAFIALEEGIDGLIHISDMSWTQRIKHPSEILKKGQKVRAVVLNVDKESERLSLGLKQMEPDPWTQVPTQYQVGQDVRVKIVKVASFGAFAELEDGVEGLIHLSELSGERVNDPGEVVEVGQELDTKIIKIDAGSRKIGLSIRAFTEESAQHELDKVNRQASDAVTIGDMVSDEMAGLRSVLMEAEKNNQEQN
ncbi:30S ribosomal protein S1 [Candidatus Entotheonellaceae bacterium PAL068K]